MTRTNRGRYALAAGALLAGGLLAALTQPVQAQQAAQLDSRWQGWVGCWAPAGAPAAARNDSSTGAQVTCVVPAAGTPGVDIATIAGGKLVSRERVVATGERIPTTDGGCTGWERAQWSAEGRRVYLRSELDCSGGKGGLLQKSEGVLAMSPSGEWLDVRGVTVGQGTGVHVTRYRAVPAPATLPSEIASALPAARTTAMRAARIAAEAPLTTAEVIEASKYLSSSVLQTWLVAQHEGFALDDKQLVALADAGVPDPVIDAMVALSYPKAFAIRAGAVAGGVQPASTDEREGTRSVVVLDPYGYYSPFGYDYSPFGYSPFGYSSFGYSPFGYGIGYGWYGGGSPVVIVRNSDRDNSRTSHGTMVKGRGYTPSPGARSTGRHAAPRSGVRSSGASTRIRSSGSSVRTTTSHPTAVRKAKPRHPDGNH